MNEQELTRSERIASRIMRALAVIGLVSILALAAWMIVQSVRLLPNGGEGLRATVTSITSVFRSESEESIAFTLPSSTYASGDPATLSWNYEGDNDIQSFILSYSCVQGISLSVSTQTGWKEYPCDTAIPVDGRTATVIPTATKTRFNDVILKLSAGGLEDSRMVTIINSNLASALPGDTENDDLETSPDDTENTPEVVAPEVVTPAPVTPVKPTPVRPAPTPVTPVVRTPADLALSITATGVLAEVQGKDTFFTIDPIPADRTAGVKFTVTNRGGVRSSAWTFIANLPIEGDSDYKYTSPMQSPLDPGAQVEFTLGFDELLEEKTGTIRITLIPVDTKDPSNNNVDSERINIR